MNDQEYMKMAIELAERGRGSVAPNPMVGAVVVKDGEIIGCGFHEKFGGPHAERNALLDCVRDPEGAVLYVTLEPCCHFGKTPPCTDAILKSKIGRVVVGIRDPNPVVAGKGIERLREAGIDVEEGVLEEQCRALNEVFFHNIIAGTPFVAMKFAMTLDGKIATRTGASKWITGNAAREHTHGLRNRYTAILVGINTVLADDPLLTCRLIGGKNPVRIVCDTHLRMPIDAQLVRTAGETPLWIACDADSTKKARVLESKGCRLLRAESRDGRVDFRSLMALLHREGIDSILIEGGAAIHFSALSAGAVQKVYAYISPQIFGGDQAKTPVGGEGVGAVADAFRFRCRGHQWLGEDFLLEYERE